jgi:hypothetical protein
MQQLIGDSLKSGDDNDNMLVPRCACNDSRGGTNAIWIGD